MGRLEGFQDGDTVYTGFLPSRDGRDAVWIVRGEVFSAENGLVKQVESIGLGRENIALAANVDRVSDFMEITATEQEMWQRLAAEFAKRRDEIGRQAEACLAKAARLAVGEALPV